ncbi:hypothetical protein D3C87_253540 [compost metagenome]
MQSLFVMNKLIPSFLLASLIGANWAYGQNIDTLKGLVSQNKAYVLHLGLDPSRIDEVLKQQMTLDLKTLSQSAEKKGGSAAILDGQNLRLAYLGKGLDSEPAIQAETSKSLREKGLERAAILYPDIYQSVLTQLKEDHESSPAMAALAARALMSAPLYITQFSLQDKGQSALEDSQRLISVYERGYGTFIMQKDFESLPKRHQMGVILHEALRSLQIEEKVGLSLMSLQKFVAQVLGSSSGSLDRVEYLQGPPLSAHLESSQFIFKTKSYVDKMCEIYGPSTKLFCDLESAPIMTTLSELVYDELTEWKKNFRQDSKSEKDHFEGITLVSDLNTHESVQRIDSNMDGDLYVFDKDYPQYSFVSVLLEEYNRGSSSEAKELDKVIKEIKAGK